MKELGLALTEGASRRGAWSRGGPWRLQTIRAALAIGARCVPRASVNHFKEETMPVAKVEEISATSTTSFDDAIRVGLERARKTLRNVRSAWVKEMQVRCDQGNAYEYQVNLQITFVLED
jgi:flavin-binding protein dodecin